MRGPVSTSVSAVGLVSIAQFLNLSNPIGNTVCWKLQDDPEGRLFRHLHLAQSRQKSVATAGNIASQSSFYCYKDARIRLPRSLAASKAHHCNFLIIISNDLNVISKYVYCHSVPRAYLSQTHIIAVMSTWLQLRIFRAASTGLLASRVHNHNNVREIIIIICT